VGCDDIVVMMLVGEGAVEVGKYNCGDGFLWQINGTSRTTTAFQPTEIFRFGVNGLEEKSIEDIQHVKSCISIIVGFRGLH
jgi:hypothetical protein